MNRTLPPQDPGVDGPWMAFSDGSAEPRPLKRRPPPELMPAVLSSSPFADTTSRPIYSDGPEPEAAHRKKATLDGDGRGGRRRSR